MNFAATARPRAGCSLSALELMPLDPQAAHHGGHAQAHEQHEERDNQAHRAGDNDVGLMIGRRVNPGQLEYVVHYEGAKDETGNEHERQEVRAKTCKVSTPAHPDSMATTTSV